jgi:hypothetical protein
MPPHPERRDLTGAHVFLHAHSDDEAIFTAATMHRLARRGPTWGSGPGRGTPAQRDRTHVHDHQHGGPGSARDARAPSTSWRTTTPRGTHRPLIGAHQALGDTAFPMQPVSE